MQLSVVRAVSGGEKAGNVFDQQNTGLRGHFVEDSKPLPDKTASAGLDTAYGACQRQILTGEARPGEMRERQVGTANALYIMQQKMFRTEVRLVDARLLRADVVRPKGCEHALQSVGDQAASGEEFVHRPRRIGQIDSFTARKRQNGLQHTRSLPSAFLVFHRAREYLSAEGRLLRSGRSPHHVTAIRPLSQQVESLSRSRKVRGCFVFRPSMMAARGMS